MKVEFLMAIAAADWSFAPKEVAEVDNGLAAKFIESGICKAVAVEPPAPAPAPPAEAPKAKAK